LPGILMMKRSEDERLRVWLNRLKRLFKRNPEVHEDPYSYVMAPKKPIPPTRSAAAVAEWPEDNLSCPRELL
jgi:hypothetical protein